MGFPASLLKLAVFLLGGALEQLSHLSDVHLVGWNRHREKGEGVNIRGIPLF